MNRDEAKEVFNRKLKWYKADQNNPILPCIKDDFNDVVEQVFNYFENRSCANCKRVDKCKLANDVVNNFGTKLKEQYFYCWESK